MFALLYNLYKFLREKSERKITLVILGVDNAGKTTLLHTLKGEHDKETSPTFGFNSSVNSAQELGLGGKNLILQVFDLGGGQSIRRVWKSYLAEVHGVVFVVDAAHRSRFDECKQVLVQTIDQKHLHGKPILVLANKQDLDGAAPSAEVAAHLGLPDLKANDFHIKACTAKSQPGQPTDPRLHEGMKWLLSTVGSMFSQLDSRVQQDAAEVKQEDLRRKKEREERARKIKEERLQQQRAEEQQWAEEEATAAAIAAAKAELGVAQAEEEEGGDKTKKEGNGEMGNERGAAATASVETLSSAAAAAATAGNHQGSADTEDSGNKARESAPLQRHPPEAEGERIPLLGAMGEERVGMRGNGDAGELEQQQTRQQQQQPGVAGPVLPGGIESPTLTPVAQAQGGHQPRHFNCSPPQAGVEESVTLCPLAAQPSPKAMPNGGLFTGSASQEGDPGSSHDLHQSQQHTPWHMSSGAVRQSSRLQYMQHAERVGEAGGDAYGMHVPQLQPPPHQQHQDHYQQYQQQQQQPHLVLHPPHSPPIATPASLPDSPAANPLPQYAPPDILTPSNILALPHSQATTPLSCLSPGFQQQQPHAQGPLQSPSPSQDPYHHPLDHTHQPPRTAHTAPTTSLTGADLQGSAVSAAASASQLNNEVPRSTSADYGNAGGAQAESTGHHPPDPHQPKDGWQIDAGEGGQPSPSQEQGSVRPGSPEGSTNRPGSTSHEREGAGQRVQSIGNAGGSFGSKGSLSRQNRVAPVP